MVRMERTPTGGGRYAALAVAVLLPVLSGVIPVLDIWAQDIRDGIETHHHPGTHGLPHNHLICIQQSANHWAPDAAPPVAPASLSLKVQEQIPVSSAPLLVRLVRSPKPRSPPIA